MTEKKSIRISYYVLATSDNFARGQWKYYVMSVWGDELYFDDEGWFFLRANGQCVLADSVASLHAIKAICADYEYEFVKDIR